MEHRSQPVPQPPALDAKVAGRKLKVWVVIAGLGLFVGALFSPGIVFKPDTRSNPKRGECAVAVQDNIMCESFSFGGPGMETCGVVGSTSRSTFVDKQRILEYCKGWDAPVAGSYDGYVILLMGYLGVLLGVFAWFANPVMLLALLLSLAMKKRLAPMILSVASMALGLQSYMLEAVPFNESSMDSSNLDFVDHLGPGFYLWMGSLVTFSVCCFLKTGYGAVAAPQRNPAFTADHREMREPGRD